MVFGIFNKKGVNQSIFTSPKNNSLIFKDSHIKIYCEDKKEKIIEDKNKIIITNSKIDDFNLDNPEFIKKIEGTFYLLRYNKNKKELDLSTDRLGIGDLFYSKKKGSIFFATALKDLFKLGLNKAIDAVSLRYYLVYQFIPRPLTMFKGVVKVPAASIVEISDEITINKYWDLDFNPVKLDDEKYHAKFVKKLLTNSIKQNVESLRNKKIGLLLSGGLDSSIIAYTLKGLNVDFYTFTGVYPYDNMYGGNRFGKKVAKDVGSRHIEIKIGPDAIKRLPELYDNMYEPLADSSLLQAHIIMDKAKKITPNLFAGEFSDILFAGMQTYVKDKIARLFWEKIPIKNKIMIKNNTGSSVVEEFINQNENFSEFKHYKYGEIFFTSREVADIFNDKIKSSFNDVKLNRPIIDIYNNINFDNELDKQLYTDLKLASQRRIFHLTEPAKINSVNLILPYTNSRLIDYSGKIPGDLKIKGMKQKYILKKAFENMIPKYITNRPKEGFTAPFNLWFKHNKDWILNQFEKNKLWSKKARNFVEMIIDKESANYNENMKVWILLNLSIWYQKVFS